MAERSHPDGKSPAALPGVASLESILCTEELHRRPARPPDYRAENRTLAVLVQALANAPHTILQTLADNILEALHTESAGISLLTEDAKRFYWPAIAGIWKPHVGGGTPRDFGPCGDVLDRNASLLFRHPERRYTYFLPVTPLIEECLLVPFYVQGQVVGTIWAIAHDSRRKFDSEDLRQLESLGRFASAAYQAGASLDALEERSAALGQSHSELSQRMAELQKQGTEARDTRRAALNLMEDAVHTRQTVEKLNAELRESEDRLERELTATQQLQSASALLIEGGDTRALYEKIVEAAAAIMRSDGASMQTFDEGADALRLLAWQGFDPSFGEIFAVVGPEARTVCNAARQSGHRVIVPDVETCDFIAGTPALSDFLKMDIRAVQATPLCSRDGRLLGMISTHWRAAHTPEEGDLRQFDILARQAADLIERKQGENSLRESEERYRSLVSVITDVPWISDAEGRFVTPQPAWEAYTAQTSEQYNSLGWLDAFHPKDRARVRKLWEKACASHTLFQSDGRLWHAPSQQWRHFTAKATPLFNAAGGVREWVGTYTDVDDQVRAKERLTKTVAERTADLRRANVALWREMEERQKVTEQLIQAQKMESVGVLAGGIAHDFNNILNIIQGYASVLSAQRTEKGEFGQSIDIINETVERGSALVRQLLTLARKGTTNVTRVDINGLVSGMIQLMTQTFPKTIELSAALEADLPPITADKNQIEQALLNLCVNARDAMSDRGQLTMKTHIIDGATVQDLGGLRGGIYVCVEVSDTGKGIDESIRKRIFEPFFTTKGLGEGTGLGLAVVYGIVSSHHGLIDVDSNLNRGTSFRLYFPVSRESSTEELSAEAAFEPARRSANGTETVLVVEDEQHMRDLLEKILAGRGYRVLTAGDGETALDIYRDCKEAIDVVLLDLGLPKMPGQDLLLKLKDENPEVRVAIASGYLTAELQSKIEQAGVTSFLHKPYKTDQVIDMVQRLVLGESGH